MAKRKKKGFKTDKMTVDQIIHLGDKVLNKMDKRELSHALRTVSLAANKRLKRLEAHGIFDPETERWSETSNLGIDFDALYYTQGRRFVFHICKPRSSAIKMIVRNTEEQNWADVLKTKQLAEI